MKRILVATGVFSAAALMGPTFRWLTWPPSTFEQRTSAWVSGFIYDLVSLLWPTQAFGDAATEGWHLRGVLQTVTPTIGLFATLGVVAGIVVKYRFGLWALYTCVALATIGLAWMWSGFSMGYFSACAVLSALMLHAVPFWLTARFALRRSFTQQRPR